MKKALLILLLITISSNQFLNAQKKNIEEPINTILSDKFDFELGAFIPTKDVRVSVNGSSVDNTISFDESFGFKKNETTPYFNFNWRFSRMWKLSAEYFQLKTADKADLDEDISWGKLIFKENTFVEAGYGLELYRIFVGRVIFKNSKQELGGGIGFHAMNVSAFIEGRAYLENSETGETEDVGVTRSNVEAFLPLPNIGIYYTYCFSPKWAFSIKADWFGLKIDSFSGILWDVDPKINFQITDHFGMRGSYRFFTINANVDRSVWEGDVKLDFQGPTVGLYYGF